MTREEFGRRLGEVSDARRDAVMEMMWDGINMHAKYEVHEALFKALVKDMSELFDKAAVAKVRVLRERGRVG